MTVDVGLAAAGQCPTAFRPALELGQPIDEPPRARTGYHGHKTKPVSLVTLKELFDFHILDERRGEKVRTDEQDRDPALEQLLVNQGLPSLADPNCGICPHIDQALSLKDREVRDEPFPPLAIDVAVRDEDLCPRHHTRPMGPSRAGCKAELQDPSRPSIG